MMFSLLAAHSIGPLPKAYRRVGELLGGRMFLVLDMPEVRKMSAKGNADYKRGADIDLYY